MSICNILAFWGFYFNTVYALQIQSLVYRWAVLLNKKLLPVLLFIESSFLAQVFVVKISHWVLKLKQKGSLIIYADFDC